MAGVQRNIPALRFPEFNGEWEEKRMGDMFPKVRNGFVGTATPYYSEIGIKYLQGKNIKKGKIDSTGLIYVNQNFHNKQIKSQLRLGDVLMVQSGHVGECAVVTMEFDGGNCHALIVMSPNNHIQSCFFVFYFYSPVGRNKIYKIKTGNTIEHVLSSELKCLMVNVPLLSEQQKIGDFLTAVDGKIGVLSKKKDLLERYKKGVMQKLFSQSLRFTNKNGTPYPDWEEKMLGEIGDIIGGGTPSTGNSDYWQGEIIWLTPTEIKEKYISGSSRKITKLGLKNSSAKILPMGTLLFTSRANVADIAIAKFKMSTNQGFQSIVINNQNCNEFLYYWILHNKKEFIRKASGSTFLEISNKEVKKIKLQVPHKKEQQKIANFLSSLDQKITHVSQQLSQAQAFKKGLLQQMFV